VRGTPRARECKRGPQICPSYYHPFSAWRNVFCDALPGRSGVRTRVRVAGAGRVWWAGAGGVKDVARSLHPRTPFLLTPPVLAAFSPQRFVPNPPTGHPSAPCGSCFARIPAMRCPLPPWASTKTLTRQKPRGRGIRVSTAVFKAGSCLAARDLSRRAIRTDRRLVPHHTGTKIWSRDLSPHPLFFLVCLLFVSTGPRFPLASMRKGTSRCPEAPLPDGRGRGRGREGGGAGGAYKAPPCVRSLERCPFSLKFYTKEIEYKS